VGRGGKENLAYPPLSPEKRGGGKKIGDLKKEVVHRNGGKYNSIKPNTRKKKGGKV